MKNITVSLPDDVYTKARVRAAQRDTSVSALVREYLIQMSAGSERRAVIEAIRKAHPKFNAADRLDRDALHDRNALR